MCCCRWNRFKSEQTNKQTSEQKIDWKQFPASALKIFDHRIKLVCSFRYRYLLINIPTLEKMEMVMVVERQSMEVECEQSFYLLNAVCMNFLELYSAIDRQTNILNLVCALRL